MRNPFEQVFGADRTGKRRADRFVSVGRDQYFAVAAFPCSREAILMLSPTIV
jgi:hypothetical protein